MGDVTTTYDGTQHCSARKHSRNRDVAMDCPYTGKGEEFSPGQLVESALASCMLLSMGVWAMRNDVDLTSTKAEVEIIATDPPRIQYKEINVSVTIPKKYSEKDRIRLEHAAESCPIMHSFDKEIVIRVNYNYPE